MIHSFLSAWCNLFFPHINFGLIGQKKKTLVSESGEYLLYFVKEFSPRENIAKQIHQLKKRTKARKKLGSWKKSKTINGVASPHNPTIKERKRQFFFRLPCSCDDEQIVISPKCGSHFSQLLTTNRCFIPILYTCLKDQRKYHLQKWGHCPKKKKQNRIL